MQVPASAPLAVNRNVEQNSGISMECINHCRIYKIQAITFLVETVVKQQKTEGLIY